MLHNLASRIGHRKPAGSVYTGMPHETFGHAWLVNLEAEDLDNRCMLMNLAEDLSDDDKDSVDMDLPSDSEDHDAELQALCMSHWFGHRKPAPKPAAPKVNVEHKKTLDKMNATLKKFEAVAAKMDKQKAAEKAKQAAKKALEAGNQWVVIAPEHQDVLTPKLKEALKKKLDAKKLGKAHKELQGVDWKEVEDAAKALQKVGLI